MYRAPKAQDVEQKIQRLRLDKAPAPRRFSRQELSSRASVLAALRRLYGKSDKPVKVYRLNRNTGDKTAFMSSVNHDYRSSLGEADQE